MQIVPADIFPPQQQRRPQSGQGQDRTTLTQNPIQKPRARIHPHLNITQPICQSGEVVQVARRALARVLQLQEGLREHYDHRLEALQFPRGSEQTAVVHEDCSKIGGDYCAGTVMTYILGGFMAAMAQFELRYRFIQIL